MARTEPRLILICPGNPGDRYAATRHNAGYLFADWLARQEDFGDFEPLPDAEALAAEGRVAGVRSLLVKPTTGMNDCGRVLEPLARDYPLDEHLWALAHDDLDVPLGNVKGRQKGGHGGHNGVRSILAAAGRRDVVRIKLGVASPRKAEYDSVADFLLSEFTAEEREELTDSFPRARKVLTDQLKSFAAQTARADRRRELGERYQRTALDQARKAVADIGPASPYPVFLRPAQMGRTFDVVTALAKLLRKARAAAADNEDFRRRLIDFIPEDLRPLLPERVGSGRILFAADMHLQDERLKVVELNCAVGYGHYAALADEALLPLVRDLDADAERPNHERFAPFLYRHGLKPLHDPQAGIIAFLRGFNDEDMFNVDELEGVARRVEQESGAAVPLCHESQLELREDGLYLEEAGRVDLLYVEENLSEWSEVAPESALRRAVEAGLIKTFPPLETFLYTSKGFPALLCDPEVQDLLEPDEAEQKVLRENVLWSHALDRHVESAAYYMLEQGLPLVLKESLGGGGRGVTILRPDSSSQEAGHLLRRAMAEGGSVLQGHFEAGSLWEGSDFRFDLRVVCAAHADDIVTGPVYGRVFRGSKLSLSDADAGVAPVYVLR